MDKRLQEIFNDVKTKKITSVSERLFEFEILFTKDESGKSLLEYVLEQNTYISSEFESRFAEYPEVICMYLDKDKYLGNIPITEETLFTSYNGKYIIEYFAEKNKIYSAKVGSVQNHLEIFDVFEKYERYYDFNYLNEKIIEDLFTLQPDGSFYVEKFVSNDKFFTQLISVVKNPCIIGVCRKHGKKDLIKYVNEDLLLKDSGNGKTYLEELLNEGIELNEQEQYDYQLYQKSITSADQTNIFKIQDKGYSVQKHDNSSYYVNFVNDVKYRSKQGIPQTKNIIPLKSFTIINKSTISGKKGVESYVDENNKYNDVSISTIIDNFDKGFYELLPYEGYNIYGCSLVKTCFNTIGKEHQYIHPFIDYDLEHNEYDFAGEIDVLLSLLIDYTKLILQPDKTGKSNNHNFKISIIGYSNLINEDYYELFNNRYGNNYYFDNESYIKIQAKPDAPKALSLHIVFYDVKIECRELKHRIIENKDKLKEYKGFDIAPYLSGSLRHIASIKAGLTDTLTANSKRVDNLTSSEILHQLITYHNKYINKR